MIFTILTLYHEDLSPSDKCAAVTRLNNALFNPRLHFDCPEPLNGRYLYIKATGVPNRWRRIFTVVLCEVMVYWETKLIINFMCFQVTLKHLKRYDKWIRSYFMYRYLFCEKPVSLIIPCQYYAKVKLWMYWLRI